MMSRRIDVLYCSRDTARSQIQALIRDIKERSVEAEKEVKEAVGKRVDALQVRQVALLGEIQYVTENKIKVLREQLESIEVGNCPPAPSEDPDKNPDPNIFVLNADAVITFRSDEDDFLEKIPTFGVVAETSTYASRSRVRGAGLGISKVGNPSYIWVHACNRVGGRRNEGGDRVEANYCTPASFEDTDVEDTRDGRYKVKFTPLVPGTFSLHIAIGPDGNAEPLKGSPFAIEVRNPTELQALGVQPCGKIVVGRPGKPCEGGDLGVVHRPHGLSFDVTGRYLIAADQGGHRLQAFNASSGDVLSTFGKKGFGAADFDSPCDIVSDGEGRFIVSDLLNHRLQVVEFLPRTMELRHVKPVGGAGEVHGKFQFPRGLGMMESGLLLVCDSGNHRVQVLDTLRNFSYVREFGSHGTGDGQFVTPLDVDVNRDGEILVSDSCHRIQVFDDQGVYLRTFGSKGRKDGFFNYPSNLVVSDENLLLICDQSNHRVQILDASDGRFLRKWGGAVGKAGEDVPEEIDALLQEEWVGLRSPAGIAVDNRGMIAISDYERNTMFIF